MKTWIIFLSLNCLIPTFVWSQTINDLETEKYKINSSLLLNEIEMLVSYIKIPFQTGNEKLAGEYLREICIKSGLHIIQFGEKNGNFNFAASLYPLNQKKPNLIFLHHIDVFSTGEIIRWIHPPLDGRLIENEIWGRGAFDNKGMAIIQLSVIRSYVSQSKIEDFPFNITLLSISCEETQCPGGTKFIIDNHLIDLNPWAMIGEGPPALNDIIPSYPEMFVFGIGRGQKKALWLKLELEIPTISHSAVTPNEYANLSMVKALHELIKKQPKIIFNTENKEILSHLGKWEGGINEFLLKTPTLFKFLIKKQLRKQPDVAALFTNTITITNISNPTVAQNAIPKKVTALLDCRLLTNTDVYKFISHIKKKLNNSSISVNIVYEGPNAENSDKNHIVLKMLEQSLSYYYENACIALPIFLPNLTDTNWFRSKGIPVYDITPFKMDREMMHCIHGYNERIPISGI